MMGPLARAFERSVLERPKDGGLFGPQSMVWRVHRDRSFPLAAIRSLMVQALHPLAMAGVANTAIGSAIPSVASRPRQATFSPSPTATLPPPRVPRPVCARFTPTCAGLTP